MVSLLALAFSSVVSRISLAVSSGKSPYRISPRPRS